MPFTSPRPTTCTRPWRSRPPKPASMSWSRSPIATTVADGREMIAACRKAGVKLSVFLCMRYAPSIVKAKELVEKGAVGKIFAIRIQALGDKPAAYWTGGYSGRAKTDWRVSKEKSGGGILIMNAVHNIDAMRFITGLEATRVYAEYGTYATPVEVEDMIYVTLRYSNGAVGSIEGCSCVKGGLGDGQFRADRIYGADGQLVLTSPVKLFTTKTLDGIAPNKWQEVPQGPAVDTRTRYIEEFVDAVRAGKEPPITGEDGLAALAIIAAAYESGVTCRAVSL
ncbi:MAG: Gfo/Idh/MocA family oxidoreductase [Planctomycetes bacterium]|nr:Gfo/Idh/MocA family oxidoreductase [Planctomycetota bacterium]